MKIRLLLKGYLLFWGLIISMTSFAQEGTKQFMPNSTDRLWLEIYRSNDKYFATQSASAKERLYVYLNAGERMHFGMNMASYQDDRPNRTSLRVKDEDGNIVFSERRFPTSGTGYIASYDEAVKGPEGVVLNGSTITNADGYTPYVYTAQTTGNHYIEFETWRWDYGTSGNNKRTRRFAIQYFDVTVTDAFNNVITNPGEPNVSAGRLWSRGWAFTTTSYTNYPVKADFFVFTADEFVNKVQYEMKPYSFNFVANSYGVSLNTDDNVIEKAQSQDGDLTNTSDISEYRIFLNDPDRAVWQNTALPPPAVKVWFDDNLIFDYDYNRNPQQLSLPVPSIVLEKNNVSCPFESITMFKIESNIDGFATVLLDLDGGGYTTDGNDKALQLELKQGDNYVLWDFTNDNGVEVNDGSYTASATFLGRGPAHFPLYDVESLSGISTFSIRPFNKLGPTLYWDDSQVGNWGDSGGTGSMDETAQKQLTINNHLPRVWTYDSNNTLYNGNGTTMNSWFNAIDLGMPLINFDVTTGTTKCVNGEAPVLGDIHLVAGIDEVISFNQSDFTSKYYDPNDLPLTEIQIINTPSGGLLQLSGVNISDGQIIPAAQIDNITYTPPVGFGGKYTFDFTASNGTNYALQSNVVNLISNSAPTINAISDQTICTNEGLISFPITIGDNETAADDLTVIAYSHDQLAVENGSISISGTGASRLLNVVPIADQSGYAIIYVLVDDGYSQTIEEFALHIGPSVLFTGDVSVCVGGTLSLSAEEVGATYTWKKGSTILSTAQNLTVSNLTLADAGTYSLFVSKGGCAITKEFVVSIAPIVSFTGDLNLCVGETLSLSADETVATSYTWKKGTTTIGSTKVLSKAGMTLADNASDYTLEVSKEGCSNASAPFAISVVNVLDENLTVNGSQVIEGNSATISILAAEQDVVYTAYDASDNQVVSATGANADLTLTIDESDLSIGNNSFTIRGDNGNCTVDLLNSALISVNGLPTVSAQVISTDEDVPYVGNLLTGATDDDGGNLSAETSPVTPPAHGSVTILANGNYTYTPTANYNGADSFTFRICDDQTPNACVTADVTITVNAINDLPVLSNVNLSVNEDNDLVFASGDFTSAYTDEEGQALSSIQITTLPNVISGELQMLGVPVILNQVIDAVDLGNLRFIPAGNWNGAASFQWKASDGVAYSTTASTATITVSAQDDAPAFTNVTTTVIEDASNNFVVLDLNDQLTGNDNDIDGEKITYAIVSGNTSNAFKVDINTGEVAVNTSSAIDFESLSSYTVVVRATDSNSTHSDVTITINVQNSDSDIVLSVADVSITEGDVGTNNLVFTVTASDNVANDLNFNFTVSEAEATFPEDYSLESGSALISSGANSATFTIPVVGDNVVEATETFTVALNGLTAGTAPLGAVATIADNDNASLTIDDVTVSEGDGQFSFNVTLNGQVQDGLTVGYSMTDGTAKGTNDYNNASGTITFAGSNGEVENIIVPVLDDNIVEPTETFIVHLSSVLIAVDASDVATGSITNNDGQAILTIADETIDENGTTAFTVSVDKAVEGGFTVNYSATNGTAIEGDDFNVSGSSLVFIGDVNESQTFDVSGIEDVIVEGSETFTIDLSSGSSLINSSDNATGTIIDNDAAVVTIEDVIVNEGESAIFTATLNQAVVGGTVITYNLTNNGATKGTDYLEEADRTIVFAGTAGENHTFTIDTQQDAVVEPSEAFTVSLSSSNALVGVDDVATATIIDNDGTASVTLLAVTTNEGDDATFTLSLDKAVQGGVIIGYSTSNGTAIAGEDYTAGSGSLTFLGNAGETKPISIATIEDQVVEENETFTINLGESHALVDVTASELATISNDDGNATISITSSAFDESGTGTFVVSSDKAVQGGYSINYTFEAITAQADVDYDATVIPLNFVGSADESHNITVDGIDDSILEGAETFTIKLSSSSPMVVATGSATGTINDDDVAVLTIDDVSVNENETATFTVTLDNDVEGGFAVNYTFTDGSAIGGTDYSTNAMALNFAGTKNETKTFSVVVADDAVVENTEDFIVSLSCSNALIDATDNATGNIVDNDGPATVTIADVIVSEGNQAEVILQVNKAVQGGVTINYSTVDGSAKMNDDYLSKTGVVNFSGANNEQQSIFIDGVSDVVVENQEDYSINYSTSHTLVNVPVSSLVTINDDDGLATVTVEDISFNENSSGTFAVSVDKAVQGGFTLDYTLTDITAIGGTDYHNTPGSIVFSGADNQIIDVVIPAINDDVVETSEGFRINLSTNNDLVDDRDNATATILDDDNSVLLITNQSANEDGTLTFDITLSQAVDGGTNVTCSFADVTAIGGVDYNNSNQVLNFAGTAGETHTLSVPLINDDIVENDETFTVHLSSSNTLINDNATATGIITNDDGVATVSVSDVIINEDENAIITFTVDKAVQNGFEITYAAASGTAMLDEDFSSNVGSIVFDGTAGQSQSIIINTIDDAVVESSESYVLNYASNSVLAQIAVFSTVAITDNDGQATITVSNVSVNEGGNTGITLKLNKAVQGGFDLSYLFTDVETNGTDDYEAAGTPLHFTGIVDEEITLTVTAKNDDLVEGNETFTVELTPSIALVEKPNDVVVTIIDEDSANLTVEDVTVNENESMTFTVTLNKAVSGGVVVDYAITALSATAGTDYTVISNGQLAFAGTANETQTFTIDIIDDALIETDEQLQVALSSQDSQVGDDDTAIGTIIDNDGTATITVADVTVDEAAQAIVTLTLDKAVQGGFDVAFQTQAGTAGSADYTATSGTLTFNGAANESQTVTVSLSDDQVVELSEDLSVLLTESHSLVIVPASAAINITDNDGIVTLSVEDISIDETGSGEIIIKADKAIQGGFEVVYSLSGITAVADVDFINKTNTVSFAGDAGEEHTISIDAIDDSEVDVDETFSFSLSTTNTLVDASDNAIITILDDEIANRIPIAVDDDFSTDEDVILEAMDVLANDTDLADGSLMVSVYTQPTNAFVSVNADNTIKLIPEANYFGSVSFTYEVCDGESDCSSATVNVTINPINDAPVLREDAATVNQGEVLNGDNLLANDTDPEDNAITINTTPVSDVSSGTLVINTDGTFTYTPNADFFGVDEFTYQACDDGIPSLCSAATVSIIVVEKEIVNLAPIAQDDAYETGRNETLAGSVLDNDADADGNTLYVSITPISGPDNGTLLLEADGTFTYTPNADFDGSDSFVYQVCDDGEPSECATATVEIEIVVKDSDDDTIPDDVEGDGDPDDDGVPNYLDDDSDGDGYSDKEEGLGDCDNDEVPDYLDTDVCYEEYPLSKGFSPNGDGINDLYVIPWLNQFTQVSVEIFNRWGNVVYEADKYVNDWDGKSNAGFSIGDELPVGTYYYIIIIKDTKQTLKGYIYLNR